LQPSRWGFAVVVGVAVIACGAHRSSLDRLEETLLFYHSHLKAQDLERAAAYVAPEAIEDFDALHNPERNILLIEDFAVASWTEDPETEKMVVLVRANVRKRDSITMRTVRLREVWEKRGGRWVLIQERMLSASDPIEPGGTRER